MVGKKLMRLGWQLHPALSVQTMLPLPITVVSGLFLPISLENRQK